MDTDEFRDYILGFIFYKYLSEKIEDYANDLLVEDKVVYNSIDENSDDSKEMLDAIKEDTIESLGYFLKPSELFSAVAVRGNGDTDNFILEDLTEDDFEHLFEDLDLTSTKLGKTEEAKKHSYIKSVISPR
ncbi:type I restriction-modification system subunit M N-terminal domain-containing protein [Sulfurimonas sp.]|jgi:type I restriction enzyme M protein|uniref:type I restriction-modification system subunit M N-terminal domain-containing protein n=1 Tax=Sulfurimonas sp. TaxID=2022749 RepID=UPI0025D04442|nr:type I restriction-modification system subunit M N-terminal domain-containing protein [Sulfurimonas sp.]